MSGLGLVGSPATSYAELVGQLQGAQKTSAGAPAYSRFVNRPLGRRFAALAHMVGATPNQVTGVSALFSLLSIVVIATVPPTWWSGVLISSGLVLGYALDAADGQLARLRGGGTLDGEWLDHVVDAGKISALHLAVLIAFARFVDISAVWLLVPVGFTLVATVTFFAMILNDLLRARHAARTGQVVPRPASSRMRSLLVLPTDYGVMCLVFVLWGLPPLFGAAYLILFVCAAVFLVLALVKWHRDMAHLGRS